MRLKGKKAIVTGAGQGSGRGIALKLAQEGADLVIAEINPETGAQARKDVEDLGRRALFIPVDIANQPHVREMVDQVLKEWQRIDILVNNAGPRWRFPADGIGESISNLRFQIAEWRHL